MLYERNTWTVYVVHQSFRFYMFPHLYFFAQSIYFTQCVVCMYKSYVWNYIILRRYMLHVFFSSVCSLLLSMYMFPYDFLIFFLFLLFSFQFRRHTDREAHKIHCCAAATQLKFTKCTRLLRFGWNRYCFVYVCTFLLFRGRLSIAFIRSSFILETH